MGSKGRQKENDPLDDSDKSAGDRPDNLDMAELLPRNRHDQAFQGLHLELLHPGPDDLPDIHGVLETIDEPG